MQRHIYPPFFLFLVGVLTASCAAQECPPPLTLQLVLDSCDVLSGNSTISDIHSWGIRMGVNGSNEICMTPSTVVNSSFLTSESICDDDQLIDQNGVKMTPEQCRSRRGGWITQSQVGAADIAGLAALNPGWAPLDNTIDHAVAASLQFDRTSATVVSGLIEKGNMSTQSHLGLAADSTLLKTLKDGGMIGARSWGLNSGSQSVKSPRPGTLVLGGYDSASPASQFYHYPVMNTLRGQRYCPLQVTITNLAVVIQQGNKTVPKNIRQPSSPMDVCIEPYDNLFRLPDTDANQIKDLIKDVTSYDYDKDPTRPTAYQDTLLNLEPGIVYPADSADFNMTMRITINNELTIEVPHFEFQRPLRGLDKSGNVKVNTSYNELQIYKEGPAESSPVIGKAVLSQLYLFVDYETMMFHLALQNANADTPVPVSSISCASPGGGGLYATTKGLIGVGAVLGALLLLLALFGYLLYKRLWRRSPPDHTTPKPPKSSSPVLPLTPTRPSAEGEGEGVTAETFGTGQDGEAEGIPISQTFESAQPTLSEFKTTSSGTGPQGTGAVSPRASDHTNQHFSIKGGNPRDYA